jgi:site-specific recombinase XerD
MVKYARNRYSGNLSRPPSGESSPEEVLEEYRLALQAENRSPKTISWYLDILTRYFTFLKSRRLLKPIGQMGTAELRTYLLYLQGADRWSGHPSIGQGKGKLSAFSVQGHARAVKAFWGWLEREGHVQTNRLAKFPLPRVPVKPVDVLTMDQVQELLGQIDRLTPSGARYFLIILLLVDTGLRISELTSITLSNVDLIGGSVKVVGKGQKTRFVPLSPETRREISRYLKAGRPRLTPADSPYLFATPDGGPISVNSVQQYLRRLATSAGLDGVRVTPHVLRHTFATLSIANGANPFTLKEILGHTTLAMTMRYVHLQPHDLQVQHASFSPVARSGIGRHISRRQL